MNCRIEEIDEMEAAGYAELEYKFRVFPFECPCGEKFEGTQEEAERHGWKLLKTGEVCSKETVVTTPGFGAYAFGN